MASARAQGEIPAPLDEVWKVLSDFGGFLKARGVPVEVEGEGIGALRKLTLGGAPLVERLESLDEEAHSMSYSVVEGPMPVTDYLGTIKLDPAGDGTTLVTWSCTFEAAGDASETDLVDTLAGAYAWNIKKMARHFGG